MSIALSSPVTGAAQTGFTAPTYTIVADVAPDVNGKQWAVSATGGTQVGVTTHTVSSPFSITYERPKALRALGNVGPNGVYVNVPRNVHRLRVRKGVLVAANQAASIGLAEVTLSIPAGAETYDAANVRALVSALIGSLSQISAGIGDTVVTGTM